MSSVVAFTGGGTGGHIFPGIAVIEKLKAAAPSIEVLWIGSRSPLEKNILERFGIRFFAVPSGKLRRYFSLRNALDVFKIVGGFIVSFLLLRRLRPALLFSKGGFASVPPVAAARVLGIPVFTHESDVDPGLATRINARFAERIFVAYEESRRHYPSRLHPAVVVSGNPVRREIFEGDPQRGRALIGAPPGKPVLLALGGSQGAHQVNRLVEQSLQALLDDYHVVQQTGDADFRPATRAGHYTAPFFSQEFPDVLAASDLVVSRSGAGTLWELAAVGKPSILVPLESYSRGDQLKNARQFADRGAAVVLAGQDANPGALTAAARRLARDRSALTSMGRAARGIYLGDAAGSIAAEIERRIGVVNVDCPT